MESWNVRPDPQPLRHAAATGHMELKTLQRYANRRSAISASKVDDVEISILA